MRDFVLTAVYACEADGWVVSDMIRGVFAIYSSLPGTNLLYTGILYSKYFEVHTSIL